MSIADFCKWFLVAHVVVVIVVAVVIFAMKVPWWVTAWVLLFIGSAVVTSRSMN